MPEAEPSDPALDAVILNDRSAVASWMVLADFLEERGHPRAELIRIGLQLDGSNATLERSEQTHIDRHRDVLVDWPATVHVRWWRGFVSAATCDETDPQAWRALAAHRSLRFVRDLDLAGTRIRFDTVSPPDGIESLRLDGDRLDSLTVLHLPRLARLAVVLPTPWFRYETVAWVLQRFPTLSRLRFENCDARFIDAMIQQLPAFVRGGLRSLTIDCLTDAHAHRLVCDAAALGALELSARPTSLSTESRVALHKALPGWRSDLGHEHSTATDAPQCAPARFVTMPPIVEDGVTLAGSGVAISEHPELSDSADRGCRGCPSTRTHVIWFQNHGYPLGINDCDELVYELVCLVCGRFSLRSEFRSLE